MAYTPAVTPLTTPPAPNLTRRLGELKVEADRHLANLTVTFREIDKTRQALRQHGIEMSVDLGDIGNAALASHRQVEDNKDTVKFAMPRAV